MWKILPLILSSNPRLKNKGSWVLGQKAIFWKTLGAPQPTDKRLASEVRVEPHLTYFFYRAFLRLVLRSKRISSNILNNLKYSNDMIPSNGNNN